MARFTCTIAIENAHGDPALEVTAYDDAASLLAHVHATCLDADDPESQGSVARLAEWALSAAPTGTLAVHNESGMVATVTVAPREFLLPDPVPGPEDDDLPTFLWHVMVTFCESSWGDWWRLRPARRDGVVEPWGDDDNDDDDDDTDLLPWYHTGGERTQGWAVEVHFCPDGEETEEFPPKVVTEAVLRHGFDRLVARSGADLHLHHSYIGKLLAAFYTLDAGNIDAELADYLLQIVLCDTVVCS